MTANKRRKTNCDYFIYLCLFLGCINCPVSSSSSSSVCDADLYLTFSLGFWL